METIQEQFVSYEIALAMKELGFNEPCLGYYRNDSKSLFIGEDSRVQKDSVQAPLLQQCIDWFRGKYGLHIEIELTDSTIHGYYFEYTIKDSINREYCDEDFTDQARPIYCNDKYCIYQEAREQAILKCIELCKSK